MFYLWTCAQFLLMHDLAKTIARWKFRLIISVLYWGASHVCWGVSMTVCALTGSGYTCIDRGEGNPIHTKNIKIKALLNACHHLKESWRDILFDKGNFRGDTWNFMWFQSPHKGSRWSVSSGVYQKPRLNNVITLRSISSLQMAENIIYFTFEFWRGGIVWHLTDDSPNHCRVRAHMLISTVQNGSHTLEWHFL